MFPLDLIRLAASHIAPHVKRTLVTCNQSRQLCLGWENPQVTGMKTSGGKTQPGIHAKTPVCYEAEV
jgi:hypothetical protein